MTLQAYGSDSFQSGGRTLWSPASDGANWTQAAGAGTLSIIADAGRNRGKITNSTVANVLYESALLMTDIDLYVRVNVSSTLVRPSLIGRSTGTTTYYRCDFTGTTFEIFLNNGGAGTTLASVTIAPSASTYYWMHFRIQGFGAVGSNPNNLMANFWADPAVGAGATPTGEPAGWMLTASDGTLTAPGNFGLHYKATTTGQFAYFDAFTATDCPPPAVAPAYNTVGNRPYGMTLYVPSNGTPLQNQTIIDLIGTCSLGSNPASATGLGLGCWLRWQGKWNAFEPYVGLYDWGIVDDAIQKANYWGFNILWPIQKVPAFRATRDGLGSNCTLSAARNAGTAYTTLAVTALPDGAYIPHKAVITVNYGNAGQEVLFVWNPAATYVVGATSIGISTSNSSQVAWTPATTHAIGQQIWQGDGTVPNGGPQYGSAADYATFCGLVAARYNGSAGFGKVDMMQIENEDYDSANRLGAQGAYNTGSSSPSTWDKSSTWDNGGAILAPVYKAARDAIVAVYPTCPVFCCSVRKAPATARQHVINWVTGFVTQVQAAGGTVDGQDLHFYRDSTVDWNGAFVQDPTIPTYTDSTKTVVNAPSIAMEIADITAVYTAAGLSPLIMTGETGWPVYDDRLGVIGTTTTTRNIGAGPFTTLDVNALPAAIPDATLITVDDNNTAITELVYAYGQAAKNATTIQITNNPLGSGATQTGWSPAHNHASGAEIYGATSQNPISPGLQSTYLKSMFDAGRLGGADYCFVFTIDPTPIVHTDKNPAWSSSKDSITQNIAGVYTYEPAYSMMAADSATFPSWQPFGTVIPGTYSMTIGGLPVNVLSTSLSVKNTIGRRGEMTVVVYDAAGATHFQQYQQCAVRDQSSSLAWSGYLTSPVETKPGFSPLLLTSLTATDQRFVADKRIVAQVYHNQTCGYIARDLLTTILAAEGVAVGQIAAGPIVPVASFGYCTVADALDALVTAASSSGVPYYWQIDQNKLLWFVPYTAVSGGTVDGTQIDDGRLSGITPSVTRANPKYRNTQYGIGGVSQTPSNDETRAGDGQSRAFTFSYPLASAPTLFTLNGTAKTLGVKGQTGYQYYWAQGDPVISQDSGQTILISSDRLRAIYVGQLPTTFTAQNAAAIAAQKALDGTSGIIEAVLTDKTIATAADGNAKVNQQLTQYGMPGLLFVFATQNPGYQAGQLITVNYAPLGLSSAQMLISEVAISDQQGGPVLWYTVSAVQGPYDVTWTDFFGNLFKPETIANSINLGVALPGNLFPQATTLFPSATTLFPT